MPEIELKSNKWQRRAVIASVILNGFFFWLVFLHKKQLQIIFKGTFMYVLLAYGLGILTFYLLWYKKPPQTVWQIAKVIIDQEAIFFPSGYTLDKDNLEIDELYTEVKIPIGLFYFSDIEPSRVFKWDIVKNRVTGSIIGELSSVKENIIQNYNETTTNVQKEVDEKVMKKIDELGLTRS